MFEQIPPIPIEGLSEWKGRALLDRLKADFPEAPDHLLEKAINQAAALLWPGLNFAALSASASMLVRKSSG